MNKLTLDLQITFQTTWHRYNHTLFPVTYFSFCKILFKGKKWATVNYIQVKSNALHFSNNINILLGNRGREFVIGTLKKGIIILAQYKSFFKIKQKTKKGIKRSMKSKWLYCLVYKYFSSVWIIISLLYRFQKNISLLRT